MLRVPGTAAVAQEQYVAALADAGHRRLTQAAELGRQCGAGRRLHGVVLRELRGVIAVDVAGAHAFGAPSRQLRRAARARIASNRSPMARISKVFAA